MSASITARTAVLLTLPPLLWAGNAVVGRLAVGSVPPLTLNFLRWLLAALILLPLGWRALCAPREIIARWPHLPLVFAEILQDKRFAAGDLVSPYQSVSPSGV